ncbi:hypothetical protein VEE44_28860 [Escherichia coli]|nr:hypothetical protein VEE44_28860 [Escherichia coli]
MSQTQIQSLTTFFKDNVPPRAMQSFDSVLDEMKFIPAAKDYGLGQYRQAVTSDPDYAARGGDER